MTINYCEITSLADYLSSEKIEEVLEAHKEQIEKYAFILHDKDTYSAEDELSEKKAAQNEHRSPNPNIIPGKLKPAHYHVILKFVNRKQPSRFSTVAHWFGLQENFISKCTSKNASKGKEARFLDMCAYLIHLNAESKYQYSTSEVTSNFEYAKSIEQWKTAGSLEKALQGIFDGTITKFNYTDYISGEMWTYNRPRIENAFAYVQDQNRTLDRNLDVVMISGPSGAGKTTYAKILAEQKGFDRRDVFVSSSGEDILCNYKGQAVIILDDFRECQMTFSDFLKLTDNHTNSDVKSRFNNKEISNCKLMIVTSIFPVTRLFHCGPSEDPAQLYRRFIVELEMDQSSIIPYTYSMDEQRFIAYQPKENPVRKYIANLEPHGLKTDDDVNRFLGLSPSDGENS